jgi:uncharacterized protein with PQ loop repeat
MMGGVTTVFGLLGVILNQAFIWPQVRRAMGSVEGVAPLTVLGGMLARASWVAYGFVLGDVPLVVGNITVTSGFLILWYLLLRRAHVQRSLLVGLAAVVAAVAAATLAGDLVLGWFAVVTAAVVNVPQMIRVLMDRNQLAGVSVATYLLIASASTSWIVYGVLVDEALIALPHLVLGPTALVTAWVAAVSHRRH